MKKLVFVGLIVVICIAGMALTGCGKSGEKKIIIGAKNFTEQYIVGNMLSILFKEKGYKVTEKFSLASPILRKGMETGQINICMDYTGTAWTVYLKHEEKVDDAEKLYSMVKEEDAANGMVWLNRLPLNNTFALAIENAKIEVYGSSLSELAKYVNTHPGKLKFAIGYEFFERDDGFFKMAETYGMKIAEKDVKIMEIGLGYEAVVTDQLHVTMAYSTDGKLVKYNMHVLEDDKVFFPIYNLCPVVSEEFLASHPDVEEIVAPLEKFLDDETMQKLNARVDVEKIPADVVAKEFLIKKGLI